LHVLMLPYRDTSFVAVKVCTSESLQAMSVDREIAFYEHVNSLNSKHIGQAFIRDLLATFELSGPTGQHLCLVHTPMQRTIRERQFQNHIHRLNKSLLNCTLFGLLPGLSCLHDEANVVHAGKSGFYYFGENTTHIYQDINPSTVARQKCCAPRILALNPALTTF